LGRVKRELSNDAVEGTKGGRGDPARPGLDEATSHYRIIEKLGAFGVVYNAEDVKLHRCFALKFLPHEIAKDTQALARFQREARPLLH